MEAFTNTRSLSEVDPEARKIRHPCKRRVVSGALVRKLPSTNPTALSSFPFFLRSLILSEKPSSVVAKCSPAPSCKGLQWTGFRWCFVFVVKGKGCEEARRVPFTQFRFVLVGTQHQPPDLSQSFRASAIDAVQDDNQIVHASTGPMCCL